jgi:hypothetical protein
MKRGYRASDRREFIEFMINDHRRLCSLQKLAGMDNQDEDNEEEAAASVTQVNALQKVRRF